MRIYNYPSRPAEHRVARIINRGLAAQKEDLAAVTRRAYAKELRDRQPDIVRDDNERLEFLGDGVLELAVGRSLCARRRIK